MSKFKNFMPETAVEGIVEKTQREMLADGNHDVKIADCAIVNDAITNFSGEVKSEDKMPPWKDRTPQILFMFTGEKGIVFHRNSLLGYKKFADLADEEKANFVPMGEAEYAVNKKTNMRVVDEVATKHCTNIIAERLLAFGAKVGTGWNNTGELLDIVDSVSQNSATITVERNDRGIAEVTKIKKVGSTEEISSTESKKRDF